MDEDDAYWRLSFSEGRTQGRRSTGGINSLWYDSDHEFEDPVPSFKSLGLREQNVLQREECRNFDDVVFDIKKMKQKQGRHKTATHKDVYGHVSRKLRLRIAREKQEAESERGFNDGKDKLPHLVERENFPMEPDNMVQMEGNVWKLAASSSRKHPQNPDFRLTSVEEDCVFEPSERAAISEWQNLGDSKFKEIKVQIDSLKKSACRSYKESYCRTTKRNNRVKAYSSRSECKIRALEEMKKAGTKWKKQEIKEQVVGGKTVFDSFAVVKSSLNPQQDFRDSMVEMIREKGIERPEDLEELLACYLTLNCDEYHDLIISVFQQIWSEITGVY